MKKPNITPGPWRIKDHEIEDFRVFGNCEGGALARVIKANNFGGTAQDQANARLIAAAPAMAEALEAALVGLESDILYCERHPDSHRTTHEGMLAHKRKRLNDAKAALTLAGYEF